MQPAYIAYLIWVIVVPATTTAAIILIARATVYPPITIALNGLILFTIGFATTRFLPGRRLIKLGLLFLIPLGQMIFWQGESEPGLERFDQLIYAIIAILLLVGGIAGFARSRSQDMPVE